MQLSCKKSSPLRVWLAGFRFDRLELSGSLGDLGTFLPLVVAMVLASHLDLGVVLVCAGLMNVITGLLFRQPIPVQPMKAIAAVAITEGLTQGELVASGLALGGIMLALSLTGAIGVLTRWVPRAVVRGIQLGVGLKLAVQGFASMGKLPWLGADCVLLGVGAAALLLGLWAWRKPAVLWLFLGGLAYLGLVKPEAYQGLTLGLPDLSLHWPAGADWAGGLWKAGLPQVPLTVLNSVLAVCALSADYFPGQGISPRRMAASVGLMNLVCAPLGGIPMCHGSGGLAAQVLFGARTGGSVVMLGLGKALAGLAFGGALLSLLQAYPSAILGVLLVFAGLELARAARESLAGSGLVVALATAAAILGLDTAAGFLIGCALAALAWLGRRFSITTDPKEGIHADEGAGRCAAPGVPGSEPRGAGGGEEAR